MSGSSSKPFLLVLTVFFAASLLGWHALNDRPSSMDETRHMKLAMDYRAWMLRDVPITNEWSHVYPPIYHLSIIPALSMGRPSETKATATHLVYFAIFVAGCVLLGRRHLREDWESILAAFLCLGYCSVLWASRRALIDFPLLAWVTLSMSLLVRTEGFSIKNASLLWGISAGIGLLMKPPFILFIMGPALWALTTSEEKGGLKNLLMSFALAVLVAAPWYFWQSAYFLSKAGRLAVEPQGPGTDPRTLQGWLYYLQLLRFQMGLPSLVFTGLGILLSFLRRHRRGNGFLMVWFISGYFFLSLLVNKDPRHSLAILPPLAMLAARGWGNFAQNLGSRFLVGAAGPLLMVLNIWTTDRPAKQDWKHGPILALMTQRHDPSQPFLLASVLSHHPYFFARTLKWSAMQEGLDVDMISPGDSNTSFTEFIIRRLGDEGSEAGELDRQWRELKPNSRAFTSVFGPIGTYTLPDQSTVLVYQRNAHPIFQLPSLTTQELERRLARALLPWVQGNLSVKVEAQPKKLAEGRLGRVRISCTGCSIQGVSVQKMDLVVENPWINLYRLWDENRLGLMAFDSLKPNIQLADSALISRLQKVKYIQDARVGFRGEKIIVHARVRGYPVTATAEVLLDTQIHPHVDAVLDRVMVRNLPIPGWILGKAHLQTLWLYPLPEFPGKILISRVDAANGLLLIS